MKAGIKIKASIIFLIVLITGIYGFQPENSTKGNYLLVTAVPVSNDLNGHDIGFDGRYPQGSYIAVIYMDDLEQSPSNLTGDFYSARAPEVSFDGQSLLFSAQKSKGESWQIYRMDLLTGDFQQITNSENDCTDPVWMADGRILFSQLDKFMDGQVIHRLYVCQADGSDEHPITFHPESAIASTMTDDGRIVTLSYQKYPEVQSPRYMALRTDGTKAELFYVSPANFSLAGQCYESEDGKVYFIEKDKTRDTGDRVVKVDFGHPLSSRLEVLNEDNLSIHSVYPARSGQLIISSREREQDPFALYSYALDDGGQKGKIISGDNYHFVEPVMAEIRRLPMKLPTIVNPSKEKGTLLCHNANQSTIKPTVQNEEEETTKMIQVIGMEGVIGEVPVEDDGSFYIEIDADKPVRFQSLNSKGEVLRGPSSWIWVRPGERRSCIGCHEDREMAPENRVPDALYNGMVSLPEGTKTEAVVLLDKRKK